MTLIEVLAALLLMGSILVALVTARSRLVNQHAEAVDIQEAVQAADVLLAEWWATEPPTVPMGGRGEVVSHPGWVWTTTEVGGAPDGLDVSVVRLSIIDERDTTSRQSHARILTEVDVLVPRGRETNANSLSKEETIADNSVSAVLLP